LQGISYFFIAHTNSGHEPNWWGLGIDGACSADAPLIHHIICSHGSWCGLLLEDEPPLGMHAVGERSARAMAERVTKEELVRRLAKKMRTDDATAEAWLEATLETMYQVFKSGKGLSLSGFGGFYVDRRGESTAFKFNPGQKLRALFGWSSTYKGKL
jgi:nucleoid DNA-binding protein